MRRLSAIVLVLVLTACESGFLDVSDSRQLAEPTAATDQTPSNQEVPVVPGQVIAMFEPGARSANALAANGAAVLRPLPFGMLLLQVSEGAERQVAEALSQNPNVRFAEPNLIHVLDACELGSCPAPGDPFFPVKWDHHNDGSIPNGNGGEVQTGGVDADIDWLEAFTILGDFQGAAKIGMVDSGIDPNHELFAGRIAETQNFHYDFYFEQGPADPDAWADVDGHGSHTSGIAAGSAPGISMRGIAYGPNVEIVVARVCGPLLLGLFNGCTEAALIEGINWAVDQGVAVLNLSLGGTVPSAGEQVALAAAREAGVLPVCAAGNDAGPVNYPAAFPECLAVSSTDWGDNLSSYSSNGAQIELAAPGGDQENDPHSWILSAWVGNNAYARTIGTSMAAPQVAGLATLLHALGVEGVQAKIDIMKESADPLGPATQFGAGRINMYQAVLAAGGGTENQAPTAAFDDDCTNLSCVFTDLSTDPEGNLVGWSWNFGDEEMSTEQNPPPHVYDQDGTYMVSLTVTDDGGLSDTETREVTVGNLPPNDPPVASFTPLCSDLDCTFTDASTDPDGNGPISSWSWNFGDGNTSEEQSPQHTYAAGGSYSVLLTVTDVGGLTSTASETVNVTAPPEPPVLAATVETRRGRTTVHLTWTPRMQADVWKASFGSQEDLDSGDYFPMPIALSKNGKYSDRLSGPLSPGYIYFVCDSSNSDRCSAPAILFLN